ncbi:MAG TPA: hypothetical protein VFU47_17260 [Armatimonadota bacterium]|nr:hypothetical protein [Armatimonadota bacterium]
MSRVDSARGANAERAAARAEAHQFPPAPAWAVGADREHRGPSGLGPGEDRPGFGQEVDEEDAQGVTGGFVRDEREVPWGEEMPAAR